MPNKKLTHGLNLSGNKVTGLPAPTENTDAATKQYVDSNTAPVQSVNTKTGPVVLSAGDIAITDTSGNFTTDTVQGAIDQLFQSASSGKTAIANAIGSPITSSNTFDQMATAITNAKTSLDTFIDKAEGTTTGSESLSDLTTKLNDVRVFKQRVKLKKNAGSTETIVLNTQVPVEKLVVCPLRLINDGAITPQAFQAGFSNTPEDIDDFLPNSNLSFENNRVHVPVITVNQNLNVVLSSANGEIKETTVNLSDKKAFRVTNITDTTLIHQSFVFRQMLVASGDIDLSNVGDLAGFDFVSFPTAANNGTISGVGVFLGYALSFDSGATWWGKGSDQFGNYLPIPTPLTVNNLYGRMIRLNILRASGGGPMSSTNDEYVKLNNLRGESNTLRLAYIIERHDFDTETFIDTMNLYGNFKGQLAPTTTVGISYNSANKTITCSFNDTDTYQINWIDT